MKRPVTRKPADRRRQLNAFIYGGSGVGKTYFLGSALNAPEFFGKCMLLAVDPGDLTLDREDLDIEGLEVVDIVSTAQLLEVYDWLATENAKTGEFGTLLIDGYTDISDLALREFLDGAARLDPSKDLYKADVTHWGRLSLFMQEIMRKFRNLPMHVVATALEKEIKNEANGALHTQPALSGKTASMAQAMHDIVGYLSTELAMSRKRIKGEEAEVAAITRVLQVQPTSTILAKDRTNRLGARVINPTLPEIVRIIQTTEASSTAPTVAPKIRRKRF